MSKKLKGFALMPVEKRREIASLGGKTAHANGVAHQFTPELARIAGSKGGQARMANRRARAAGATGQAGTSHSLPVPGYKEAEIR